MDIQKANKILQMVEEHGAACNADAGRRLMVDVANGLFVFYFVITLEKLLKILLFFIIYKH
jgi:hypothetical protein